MNIAEAKRILQVYRPNGRDASAPEFAAALELARRDPELGRWLAEQQSFDAAISRGLKEEPVPLHLKAALLSLSPAEATPAWWREPLRLAWAAALVGMLGLAGVYLWSARPSYADFRQELIANSWDSSQHLQLISSDLSQIRRWLAEQQLDSAFVLPPGLENMTLRGCRVVECQGKRAAQFCLLAGSRHNHLFILDRVHLLGSPEEGWPQYESCDGWNTISWAQGEKLYVLSGMRMWTFVKKFRQRGHWAWAG